MIPDWIIKRLTKFGNCYLNVNENTYRIKELEKAVGKKLRKRPATIVGCGIVLEVV